MLLCFLALPSLVGGVDVVMATDRFTLPGLVVAVNSVLNATSNPLTITVVSPKDARRRVASVLNCVFRGLEEDKLKVIGFDVPLLLLNDSSRLEVPMNYARFYLDQMLYPEKRVVVWLDADVVVLRDLNFLPNKLNHPVAAVPRQKILKLLSREAPEEDLISFNAGVAVFDLREWRSVDVFRWINLHHQSRLYQHSTNPPLVLALRNRFDRLDPEWNCAGFGFHDLQALKTKLSPECLEHPAVLHWTGPYKPWLSDGKHRDLWLSHNPPNAHNCLH